MTGRVLVYLAALLVVTGGQLGTTRIIGGHEVSEDEETPGDISLRKRVRGKLSHVCGGVLIHPRWILTAAHCLVNSVAQEWEVHIAGREKHRVAKIVARQYNKNTGRNDLALVRLKRRSREDVTQLPTLDYKPAGNCSVSGYGVTSVYDDTLPSTLHTAWVEVVESSQCQLALGRYQQLPDDALCAGGGTTDACQGDSGSPLICEDGGFQGEPSSGRAVVAGIVSAGFLRCATPGVPGIYASVAWHRAWVDWVLSK